ncbi:DUF4118 domain-containing protein [Streptomyces sp. NPDC127097]|uniref:DUF4118 domain-containing protein n=1 Tax=Streptomyces sp. NPDC127097 TaxID=3347136 RepID=UPI0036504D63
MPTRWLITFGAIAVFAAAHLSAHPLVALVLLSVLACAAGLRGGMLPALLAGPICWMLLNGFIVHRYGELHWDGTADTLRFAVLAAAALAGGGVAGLAPRARWVRARGRAVRRRLEPFAPHPGAKDTWFWN